ncbi:MAG: DUF4395 domain-containing protein [Dehalogenimonas sp.]|uniref:DUF4395 domain-containing protein n=1 Tax=Candidatus Dehalogenimonas loeffleri TaxID=3127115 RepID=A0ABZ2J5B4_9CHLR|nr:DUF4395 domain-containing protein [Dehalogenimonas sp.]
MKEIPVPYLRANQTGIVALVVLAVVTQSPLILTALLLIELAGLIFGLKANLFVQIAKPLLKNLIAGSPTEARELARFNNTLAVIFLSLAAILFTLGLTIAGFVVAGVLAVVVSFALGGRCLGCVLYYQYKLLKSSISVKTPSS